MSNRSNAALIEKPEFKVGDTVSFRSGTRRLVGEVVEDRGPIGAGGRRLYDIRFTMGTTYSEPQNVELPAELLKAIE